MTEFEMQVLIAPYRAEVEAVAAKHILFGLPGSVGTRNVWGVSEPYISWRALAAKIPPKYEMPLWLYILTKYGPFKQWKAPND